MNLVERAKNILLSPKTEWPVIEGEASTIKSIYLEYLVVLAAIPAVCSFIGMTLVGYSVMGMSIKIPFVTGLANLIVSYALSLVLIFLVGLIADALASGFGGQKNPLAAFKLAAYSFTAALLGGIFSLLPALSILGVLAGLYGIYVLYLGVTPLMKVPQDKAIGYTAVLVICAIVASVVIGAVTGVVTALGSHGTAMSTVGDAGGTAPINISVETPQGKVQIDSQKLDAMSQKLEELGKQAEAAATAGDSQASMEAAAQALKAMGEALGAQSAAK